MSYLCCAVSLYFAVTLVAHRTFRSYWWTLKPTNFHSLAIFSSTVCFSSMDLETGIHVHFKDVKMWSIRKEIAWAAVWGPLMGGVHFKDVKMWSISKEIAWAAVWGPLMGGVHFKDVKMWSIRKEIAWAAVWGPLMGGVLLRRVSISRG